MTGFQLGVFGALFLSVASSVSIVICNKALMSNLGFPFGNQYFSFVFSTDLFSFNYYTLISFLNFYYTFILTFTVTLFLSGSNNTYQLASHGNFLHPSCGKSSQFLREQVNWHEDCSALWHSKWCFHRITQFKPGIQFRWILPGIICSFL